MPFRADITEPRVLIVDDDARNRAPLALLLREEGYLVFEADGGAEAIERVPLLDPDVVVLALAMPGMDGVEVCERLRASDWTVPIVFLTAHTDRESRIRCKAAGGDDFLSKPVDDVELIVRLRNLVALRAAQRMHETHRQQMEAELEQLRAGLVRLERLATLGNLAAGVGHELKNVLAVFRSVLGELKRTQAEGAPLDPEDLAAFDWVSEHLGVHARQLQQLGRPERGNEAQTLDLCEVVSGVLTLLRTAGRTRYLTVNHALPQRRTLVRAERNRLEQILVNLVNNAVDAVEESGRSDGRIEVRLVDEAEGLVACEVRDNGTGIARDKLESVFEPWFTTKGPQKGTGLGLVVVRSLVQGLGGQLTLQSELGAGSVFRFTLPLVREEGEAGG